MNPEVTGSMDGKDRTGLSGSTDINEEQGIENLPAADPLKPPYSARVLDLGRNPTHLGCPDEPDAHAILTGWCGEIMAVFLELDGDKVRQGYFMADGCVSTMACGEMLSTMVKGLSLSEAHQITPERLIAALDGLPPWSTHCAELAVDTLREAIDGYRRKLRAAASSQAKK